MGAISGVSIAKLKIPPFIATPWHDADCAGAGSRLFRCQPIYFNSTPSYKYISPGSSITYLIPGLEIPNGVLLMFGVAIFASIILNRTLFGRYIFALGSNMKRRHGCLA